MTSTSALDGVGHDEGGRSQQQRLAIDLAWIHDGVGVVAAGDHPVGQDPVAAVEEDGVQLLLVQVGHSREEVLQRVGGSADGGREPGEGEQSFAQVAGRVEPNRSRGAQTRDLGQGRYGDAAHTGEAPRLFQQVVGDLLCCPSDAAGLQDQGEQLGVTHAVGAGQCVTFS